MNTEGDLNVELGARLNKLEKGLKDAQGSFKKYGDNVSRESRTQSSNVQETWNKSLSAIGGYMAAAFSVQVISSFAKEAVMLAAKAEGVEAAFAKLDQPSLLEGLRKATRGTVSDLELMRQAVRAENFKVPLNQLATFFEFATKRAAQTGESVDYLVNSIIDGIGRKSTLVMDNLGISAAQLQEEIKKTGDFGKAAGNIISSELAKAGDVATTSAQKIEALGTAWTNLQTEVGKKLLTSDFTTGITEFINYISTSLSIGEFFKPQDLDIYQSTLSATLLGVKRANEDAMKSGEDLDSVISRMTFKMVDAKAELKLYGQTAHQSSTRLAELKAVAAAYTQILQDLKTPQEQATKTVEDNTAAILAQADAIIAARKKIREGAPVSTRLNAPQMDNDFGLNPNVQEQFARSLKIMGDNSEIELQRVRDQFNQANIVISTFGNALNQAFTEGIDNGMNFGDAIGKMLQDLVKQMTAALLTAVALKAVFSAFVPGIGNMSFGQLFMGQMGLGGLINANSVTNGMGKMSITGSSRQQGSVILNTLNTTSQNTGRWNNNTSG